MRLYTVEVNTPVGGVQRLMAEADGMLVDLNAAGGVYYQAQGDHAVYADERTGPGPGRAAAGLPHV